VEARKICQPSRGYGDADVAAGTGKDARATGLRVLFSLLKRAKQNVIITVLGRTTNFRRLCPLSALADTVLPKSRCPRLQPCALDLAR